MRKLRVHFTLLSVALAGCDSLATDCLDMAPPGIWTKVAQPEQAIAKLFERTDDASGVLWFKNGADRYGMCQRCSGSSDYARSFQIAGAGLEKLVEQECIQ